MKKKENLRYRFGLRLSAKRKAEVQALETHLPDRSYVSAILGDAELPADGLPRYVFVYEGERPVAYGEIVCAGEALATEYELRGMVIPEYRRRGIFRQMVDGLTRGREGTFFLVCSAEQTAAQATYEALGATRVERELLMECDVQVCVKAKAVKGTRKELCLETEREEPEDGCLGRMSARLGTEEVARLGFLKQAGQVFLFSVETAEAYRGKGYATWLLERCMERFPAGTVFRLHVTESNTAAVRLYRGHGFSEVQAIERWKL